MTPITGGQAVAKLASVRSVVGAVRRTTPALRNIAMNTLAYTIAEACTATRTGKTALYEAIKTGELRAVKRGRRTLVLSADLKEWVEKLPAVECERQYREIRRGANR